MAENIIHVNAIRVRVVGAGNLRPTLFSLDDEDSQVLVPLPMLATTAIQPTPLANFKSQRVCLELRTTAINEHFKINRILIFIKPVATSFPQ